MTPGRTLSGGPAGPQPDTSSPKPPGVTLPTTNAKFLPEGIICAASFKEFLRLWLNKHRSTDADCFRRQHPSEDPVNADHGEISTLTIRAISLVDTIVWSQRTRRPKSPTSPLSQSSTSFAPSSPTTSSRRHQLRQVTSNPTLAAPPSPRIIVPPSLSRKRSSGASPTSPTQQSTSDRGSTSTPPRQNSIPDVSSSAASRVSVDGENPCGMVASPTPMVTRQLSLPSKLSLPNLRRKQSRQDDASSIAASSIDNEYETAQAEGMDFELVRPSFSHLHSARTSEDSSFVKDGGSIDLGKPELTIGGLLRTGSPAMSFSWA
ncbi:hypothetical protein PC9H_009074 [Pleurotus ostreatus]|uniref:Uncharacterized protein n=1 Tax=Pleurotus ostreatus TaxID=5322 RepID=A0A8H7DQX0_PLEOS|nr:uncharacterized protein PC9H_009074 [Pleurotus ostreatus]KAF7426705.1 hypothetical protein PC9H_009074 [Pleurotus ostreatus]